MIRWSSYRMGSSVRRPLPLLWTWIWLTARSSNPLAKFYSSATGPAPRSRPVHSPSFSSDLMDSMNSDPLSQGQTPVLVDPVTGDARLGSSTSGREAARVVKFSPEGSSRDLLVFSEVRPSCSSSSSGADRIGKHKHTYNRCPNS